MLKFEKISSEEFKKYIAGGGKAAGSTSDDDEWSRLYLLFKTQTSELSNQIIFVEHMFKEFGLPELSDDTKCPYMWVFKVNNQYYVEVTKCKNYFTIICDLKNTKSIDRKNVLEYFLNLVKPSKDN